VVREVGVVDMVVVVLVVVALVRVEEVELVVTVVVVLVVVALVRIEEVELVVVTVVVVLVLLFRTYKVRRPAAPQSSDEFPEQILLHCESGSWTGLF
jgi:hypothetical protein